MFTQTLYFKEVVSDDSRVFPEKPDTSATNAAKALEVKGDEFASGRTR